MQVLFVYASKTGCTEAIVRNLASEIDGEVTMQRATEAGPPAGYDLVVLGAPVRATKWASSAIAWAKRYENLLRKSNFAYFVVSLSPDLPNQTIPESITPLAVGQFFGWYRPERTSWMERQVLKQFGIEPCDERDPAAERAWLQDVIHQLAKKTRQP